MIRAYLIRVHFEFPDDFDGDFLVCLGISGPVDIAEGSVAHLFREDVSLQSRISGHLVGLLSLLGDKGLDVGLSVQSLAFALCLCGCSAGLGCDIAVVCGSDRVATGVGLRSPVVVLFVLANIRLTHSMFLLLCVDRRDVCGWLVAGWVDSSGLLAMTYEVLQVLYGRHCLASGRPW